MMDVRKWVTVALLCVGGWSGRPARAAARAAGGEVRLWAGGGGARVYAVETAALVYEAQRREGEVGWLLVSRLAVRAVACAEHEALLHFELRSPQLQLRGAARHAEWAARPSVWDAPAQRAASFYAHWRTGEVLRAFIDPSDPPAIANYKRALISLFQFQIIDGERNETDISGECNVLYETLNELDFRKIKTGCRWLSTEDAAHGVASRRLTRYSLRPALDALRELHSEELHELRAGDAGAAVKVRAWTRLELVSEEAGGRCAGAEPGLRAHVAALPAPLRETTLPLVSEESEDPAEDGEAEDADSEDGPLSLAAALSLAETSGAAEAEPGAGGDVAAARALLAALPALRAARADALARHMQRLADTARLTGVARFLGAAGTLAAHEACAAALQLRTEPIQPAADAYLQALGSAPSPHPGAVRAVLALAGDSPRLRYAALLAAAAAAPRAGPDVAAALRGDLAKQLARCKDDPCRAVLVSALGNLRRADCAELLLEHAARGASTVALAALRALGAAPPAALPAARIERLLDIALDGSRALDVRAAALDLGVRRCAQAAMGLAGTARALHAARADHELRRVFWQRLHALAPHHAPVRQFLRAARADPELRSWHAQAHAGTSSVLRREAGWGVGEYRAELDSAQLAQDGVLRRGVVALSLSDASNHSHPALAVELWTSGLAALAGAGGAPDEEAAGGLALEVAGARLPPVTLFSSQAELLGLVWSGAGSTPTPVLRHAGSLWVAGAALPLLAGVPTALGARAAAALALDAHAAVSLWSRTASARLHLRAALAARAHARLAAPWGRAVVTATATAPARLRIAADLDFYDKVALCVRARVDDYSLARAATLRSELGARRWRVRRARSASTARAGRTLALGRANDAACRALAPQED